MWSMCSIDTWQASHAGAAGDAVPDLSGSGTPLPRIGCLRSARRTWSRTPMIRSFGDSTFPVAHAGHASWQRPHSVHEKPSITSFFVRSKIVVDAEAELVIRQGRSVAA